jgi:hypothetical protein
MCRADAGARSVGQDISPLYCEQPQAPTGARRGDGKEKGTLIILTAMIKHIFMNRRGGWETEKEVGM